MVLKNTDSGTDSPDDAGERHLIATARAGDRESFERLVRSHMNRVFNLCTRMMGDREEAGDCAQDTFLKAYRSLKGFRGESTFATWICSIAINTCRNRLQSAAYRYGRRFLPLASAGSSVRDAADVDPPDPAPSVLDTMEHHELERCLQEAIESLPTDARTVIVLRDVEGFSYEEIARMTGWPIGTVKSRIARARGQLRERIQGVL